MIRMTFARTTLGVAATLAAFPLAAPAQAPAPAAPMANAVVLRFKFTPGQVHHYKLTTNDVLTMLSGPPSADTPLNTVTQLIIKQTVNAVRASDGAATIITNIESIHVVINGKEQLTPAARLAAMKRSATQVMLPTGKLLSLKTYNKPATASPGMDFKKSLSDTSVAFPKRPLKVGESWKDTVAVPESKGGTLPLYSTLTSLTGEGDAAQANFDQKMSGSVMLDLSKQLPLLNTKTAATVNGTAAIVFNTALGLVQSVTNDVSLNTTTTFKARPGEATPPGMPTRMRMRLRRTTTLELLPDAAAAPAN